MNKLVILRNVIKFVATVHPASEKIPQKKKGNVTYRRHESLPVLLGLGANVSRNIYVDHTELRKCSSTASTASMN